MQLKTDVAAIPLLGSETSETSLESTGKEEIGKVFGARFIKKSFSLNAECN